MRVLHILSQRPSLTGSGITLDAIVRHASAAGWEQRVVVGVPAGDSRPDGGRARSRRDPPAGFRRRRAAVSRARDERCHALPEHGLQRHDRWADLHLSSMPGATISPGSSRDFKPQIIHSHHIWLVSSLIKDLAPTTPVVTHCHATGLRQMELVPRLADEVRSGCARNDAFVVLHQGHADELGRRSPSATTGSTSSGRATAMTSSTPAVAIRAPTAGAALHRQVQQRQGAAAAPRRL